MKLTIIQRFFFGYRESFKNEEKEANPLLESLGNLFWDQFQQTPLYLGKIV